MHVSARFERQPEVPATARTFRFVFWVAVAVMAASALALGDIVIEFPARD